MVIYGAKIQSNITFPFVYSKEVEYKYIINLLHSKNTSIYSKITCGFKLYESHGRNVYLYSDREFESTKLGQPWCYEVEDIVTFYWIGGTSTIYFEPGKKGNTYLIGFWFLHLLLPLYMTFEKMYDFLHAGAVEVEGKPILFIALSMGGKSTLTDYFLQKGNTLISDDKVATFIDNKKFMTIGSLPYHRPYRRFEDLGYYAEKFMTKSKPIHAMYELSRSEPDASVKIEEIKGYEKFDTLLPNYLYVFPWLKKERFKYLSQLLNNVRVFRITVPWDMQRLEEVYKAICTHTDSLN